MPTAVTSWPERTARVSSSGCIRQLALHLAVVIFGLATLLLYVAVGRGFSSPAVFFGLLVLVLNIGWFTDAGADGSIGYFFFTAVIYALIFFRTKHSLAAFTRSSAPLNPPRGRRLRPWRR